MYRLIVFKKMRKPILKNVSESMSYQTYLKLMVSMLRGEEKDKLLRCIETEGEVGALVYIIEHEISRWNDSTGYMLNYILEKVPGDSKQEVTEHVLALLNDNALVDKSYIESFVNKYIKEIEWICRGASL